MPTPPVISEDMLAGYDILPCPVWIFEPDGLRITYANPAAQEWIGYNQDEIEGMSIADIRPEADGERLRQLVDEFSNGTRDAGHWTIRNSSGTEILAAFNWKSVSFSGRSAILATILDETRTLPDARLRSAERLLDIGRWEFDPEALQLRWSDRVFEMYGVPVSEGAPSFDDYVELVHPLDRADVIGRYQDFIEGRQDEIVFGHRVQHSDESVVHVRGVGVWHRVSGRDQVIGCVQDVTELVEMRRDLSMAERLLHMAGEKAHLGGWRVNLNPEKVIWTAGTARIHELPEDTSPTVEEAIGYYAPEYRDRIATGFNNCVKTGEPFDVVCELLTASGGRTRVRSIGSAVTDDNGEIIAVEGAFQDISALHEAEQRAADASRKLFKVLEFISDGFATLDEKWRFTYVNERGSSIFRRNRKQLLGHVLWQEFPATVDTEFQTSLMAVLETNETVRFEAYVVSLDAWLAVDAYPTTEGVAMLFRDVSIEREQKEQLRLLEAAAARLNDVLIITRAQPIDAPDGPTVVYVNDAFERITGYTRDDIIGNTPRLLQGPKTDRSELDRIRYALENRAHVRSELLNYTRSGEELHIEMDIIPLITEGKHTHFVGVGRDISERKQAQKSLRESEERFQLVSRATKDVVWDWDIVSDQLWWSEAITEQFGYRPAELEDGVECWIHRIHTRDRDRVKKSLQTALDGSANNWEDEYCFVCQDGSEADVIDRGFIMRDETGKAVRMVGSMYDITERRALEEQLQQAQKLEAVGQLTGGIAHDFNNLLTVLLFNSEELIDELKGDDNLQRLAQMMKSATERAAELTSRLLAFGRRQALRPQVININETVREMESLFRRTLPEHIDIRVVLQEDLQQTRVDPSQLESALLNLVINARDAMPDGGNLIIETENVELDEDYAASHPEVVAGPHVLLSVSDSGIGMDQSTARQVFEPFFTTKPTGEGSGLGLSMVYGFVKQSLGHISVYSELDTGTTIKLYFRQSSRTGQWQRDTTSARTRPGQGQHILVVEDDDLVRENIALILKTLGYRVSTASDGEAGLELATKLDDIQLLLTDVVMPGKFRGDRLAEEVKQLRPDIKILLMSGYTRNSMPHQQPMEQGPELLSKPFRKAELAEKLSSLLDQD